VNGCAVCFVLRSVLLEEDTKLIPDSTEGNAHDDLILSKSSLPKEHFELEISVWPLDGAGYWKMKLIYCRRI